MKTLRIAQAALATILAMGINTTAFAFMAIPTEQPADVQMSLTDMVESLREEITVGETSCEDMLAKLDAALEEIDDKLDAGVENEEEYLAARDSIVKMRYGLECLANKLVLQNGAVSLGGPNPGPIGGQGSFPSGGGVATGTGGAGSSFSGLSATGGIAGGVIAYGTSSDSGNPGFVASQAFVN